MVKNHMLMGNGDGARTLENHAKIIRPEGQTYYYQGISNPRERDSKKASKRMEWTEAVNGDA